MFNLPPTQLGAISFNIFLTIFTLVSYILCFLHYFTSKKTVKSTNEISSFISPSLFYQFWFHGYDVLIINKNEEILELYQNRIGKFFCNTKISKKFSNLETFKLKRCSCSLYHLFWSILSGLLLGLYLHFIPCFGFLSCDGSENDKIQLRGAIWFVSWFVISGIMFLFSLFPVSIFFDFKFSSS
jgi:hypothetical protein